MGLLKALDYYRSPKSKFGKEVEYQLVSWGEISAPFLGDQEHSVRGRHILESFPFKLFSSSRLVDAQLPQKLCLTFRWPYQVSYEGTKGLYSDEAAKEFTAFYHLLVGGEYSLVS